MNIFKDVDTLHLDYVPSSIKCREKEIISLITNYRCLFSGGTPIFSNFLILGKIGSGKTVISNFFAEKIKALSLEMDMALRVEYYNCGKFSSLTKIGNDILLKYTKGSGNGLSLSKTLQRIANHFSKSPQEHLLLIVDDVQMLTARKAFSEVSDDLYVLLMHAELNLEISVVIICRTQDWFKIESKQIAALSKGEISLDPYSIEDIKTIIESRAEIAFYEKVFSDSCLATLSNFVLQYDSNMRHGINLLKQIAVFLTGKKISSFPDNAINIITAKIYPDFRTDLLEVLQDQEILVLYGIAQAIYNSNATIYTTISDSYEAYRKICDSSSVKPLSKKRFYFYIRLLNYRNFVKAQNASNGCRSQIYLRDIKSEDLISLLDDILTKNFAQN